MLVALHHAPPGFPCVFDAQETFLYSVWRNATTRASPKYNNSSWSGGILVVGGFINLKEKCLIFGEKIPVFL